MTNTANLPSVSLEDISLSAQNLDPQKAAELYRKYGCFVVRGLMKPYARAMHEHIMKRVEHAVAMLDRAVKNDVGWSTPDGCLFIPAPEGFHRDKQIMTVSCSYKTSSTFFGSALDPAMIALANAVLGPNVELFQFGQVLVKEPVGGHPKMLHQDAAYFEHKYDGPMACLSYTVDCDRNNGCLHVVPGSHELGILRHVDTESHLGLDTQEWPWEKALPITGQAGDAVFFHVKTIHGSKPNHSQAPRPVFIHRYRRADDYVVVNAATAAKREEAEKHREEAKKENQLGLMVSGERVYDPER